MTTRKTHLNFVHNDEIWKDHVRHELHSLRQWPKKWGYLTTEYNNLNKDLIGEPPGNIRLKSASHTAKILRPHLPNIAAVVPSKERLRSAKKERPATPPKSQANSIDLPKLPAIRSERKMKSSTPETVMQFMSGKAPKFPFTTSGEVGWKSTLKANQLEVYGRYAPNARGQHGILNLLGWPSQGL